MKFDPQKTENSKAHRPAAEHSGENSIEPSMAAGDHFPIQRSPEDSSENEKSGFLSTVQNILGFYIPGFEEFSDKFIDSYKSKQGNMPASKDPKSDVKSDPKKDPTQDIVVPKDDPTKKDVTPKSDKTKYKKKSSPHTQEGLDSLDGKMARTVLENMGIKKYKDEPKKWFDEFVSIKLFGKTCKGIRPEFADLLKAAETRTVDKLKEKHAEVTDANSARKFMDIRQYSTSREFRKENLAYQSMHLFGMALDINVAENPWIFGVENYNSEKIQPNLTRMNALFGRKDPGKIGINPDTDVVHTSKKSKDLDDGKQVAEIYDTMSDVDDLYVDYFALLDNDEELKNLLIKTSSAEWKDKEGEPLKLEDAKKKIETDQWVLKAFASRASYDKKSNTFSNNKGGEAMESEGAMDLNKDLVVSMAQEGIDWGGKYGDMMHFDMRFTGMGKKIQAAKGASQNMKKQLNSAKKLKNLLKEIDKEYTKKSKPVPQKKLKELKKYFDAISDEEITTGYQTDIDSAKTLME